MQLEVDSFARFKLGDRERKRQKMTGGIIAVGVFRLINEGQAFQKCVGLEGVIAL